MTWSPFGSCDRRIRGRRDDHREGERIETTGSTLVFALSKLRNEIATMAPQTQRAPTLPSRPSSHIARLQSAAWRPQRESNPLSNMCKNGRLAYFSAFGWGSRRTGMSRDVRIGLRLGLPGGLPSGPRSLPCPSSIEYEPSLGGSRQRRTAPSCRVPDGDDEDVVRLDAEVEGVAGPAKENSPNIDTAVTMVERQRGGGLTEDRHGGVELPIEEIGRHGTVCDPPGTDAGELRFGVGCDEDPTARHRRARISVRASSIGLA